MIQIINEHPTDRFYLSLILFSCIGFLMESPHLLISNAGSFWKYKFRENDAVVNNTSNVSNTIQNLQSAFSLINATVPIAVISADIIFMKKMNIIHKLLTCFSSYICIFSLAIVCATIDTDPWKQKFYYAVVVLYLIAIIIKNLFYGSLINMSTGFPVANIAAITSGQAVCGIFASSLQILIFLINGSPKICGLVLFSVGLTCVVIILIVFLVILKYSMIFHYRLKQLAIRQRTAEKPKLSFIGTVFKRQKVIFLSLILAAGATKMIQPDLTSTIHSKDFGEGFAWNDTYFVPVFTFWVFYVCDFCGKVVAIKVADFMNNKAMLLLSICRFVLVPLLLILNVTNKYQVGFVFRSDIYHAIFQIVLGLTNGLGINICIFRASRKYEKLEAENAFSVIFMLVGLLLTETFSSFKSLIVKLL